MFTFTRDEVSDRAISHARLIELLETRTMHVHALKISRNDYGTFTFLTIQGPDPFGHEKTADLTLYGLGYHERRERYITEQWEWYTTSYSPAHPRPPAIPKKQWQKTLNERRQQVLLEKGPDRAQASSKSATLYNFLADLTDEDAAVTELETLDAGLSRRPCKTARKETFHEQTQSEQPYPGGPVDARGTD